MMATTMRNPCSRLTWTVMGMWMCSRPLPVAPSPFNLPPDMLKNQALVGALDRLHTIVPQAKLMQRATRAAEQLAKRSLDSQLGMLQENLGALVSGLAG